MLSSVTKTLLVGAVAVAGQGGTCRVTTTEACTLDGLPRDVSTVIYPGGKTRCIFSDSIDYGFQVIPGASDKLMIFFQGGGACFNDVSTRQAASAPCLSHVVIQPLFGIFDREKPSNPFRDYTVVHINYCSGDLHAGNVVRWYLDTAGQRVEQRGYANALSALRWTRKNLGQLSSLVIAGSSTGALGAQLWTSAILKTFSYSSAALVMDSDLGIFPKDTEGPLLKGFGACDTGLFTSDLQQKCTSQVLTIQAVLFAVLASFKEVTVAAITSVQDRMQVNFFNAVCMAEMLPERVTSYHFEEKLMDRLQSYNRYPNFVTYIMPGDGNYFLPLEAFYREDETLPRWLSTLPETPGQRISSFCETSCSTLSSKSFILTSPPVIGNGELPAEQDPKAGEAKFSLIPIPEVATMPWWSTLYHVALLSTALALCVGALMEHSSPPSSSYFASRSLDVEMDSEAEFSEDEKA